MAVPLEDHLCRFIPRDRWSVKLRRPKAVVFKQPGMSVWHLSRLADIGARLEDLQFDSLESTGQATLTTEDFVRAAKAAESKKGGSLAVGVEWRPDTVKEAWKKWSYAHFEVEVLVEADSPEKESDLLSAFRLELCDYAICTPPPGIFVEVLRSSRAPDGGYLHQILPPRRPTS